MLLNIEYSRWIWRLFFRLFMLMLMDVLICFHKGNPSKKDIIIYILSLIGFFLCGISSGIFELGCCVLPLLVFEIFDTLDKNENLKKKLCTFKIKN